MILSDSEKARLDNLFNNLHEHKIDKDSRVLIVDGMNTFIRSFSAVPTLNDNGLHIGGISGFLMSIGSAIKLLNPTRVIVVFDGEGGSLKRRKMYSGYKNGRRTKVRLNRTYSELTSMNIENKNMEIEFSRIIEYLKILPVTIISMNQIEADDTIAFLARTAFAKSKEIFIMSTDKDFLQLASENVKIWSPTKKLLYDCNQIKKEYNVYCNNFIFYRIMEGDVSDNIPGIKGAGLKTIIKAFPFITESEQLKLENFIIYAKNNIDKLKIYAKIVEGEDILIRNYNLMQLTETLIQPFTQLKITDILTKQIPHLNDFKFIQMINDDGINVLAENYDYNKWKNDVWSRLNLYN